MSMTQRYSITALFKTADEIIHAAEETARAGYTRFDVHTPYPVHGMDRAMRLKPSKLGFFALAFGLLGAVGGVGFMTWVTLVDYPLVIGGKPFWSWPAFVPVAFEITVLLASVLSVVSMIILYFKFPNTSHPLHDTAYMKRVSLDSFGISIQADDPKFDEQEVTAFLKRVGGQDVTAISYPDEERSHWKTLLEPKFLGLLALVAVLTSGATYVGLNVLLYIEPFTWMSIQPKIIPQSTAAFFPDGMGMRPPVEGTVPRNVTPYPYHGKPEEAARYLVNPLLPTKEVYARGQELFRIQCSPCHGNFGAGDSRLRGQFPNPPTLISDKLRSASDGAIFHIITDGQNVMPPYGPRINREDRWAIVHHIRALQRAQHPEESDLE
jgi:mono/diheme cytochrome c family protein